MPSAAPRSQSGHMGKLRTKTWVLLAVAAVSLYLLLPSLLAVLSSWRSLTHLEWPFAVLVFACEAGSFVALWELDRIAVRTRAWFPVIAAQLGGGALGKLLPGGAATANAFTASMLRRAGLNSADAAAGLTAASLLQIATKLALPVFALPAVVGGAPVDHSLAVASYLGIAVVGLLVAGGAVAFTTDRPLEDTGRATQWLLNATVRRRRPVAGLPRRLLELRDFVREALGAHWMRAVGASALNAGLDYAALLAALRAVGASPSPSLTLLAYGAASLLALVPFTPGGVGFVEAGLVGALTVAGVGGTDAVAATLLYRLVAYWLPIPAGAVCYVVFRQRYGALRGFRTESAPSPILAPPPPGTVGSSTRSTGR
jgi:uncharacterized protein (TIRG00374 family)